ncbi:MAG: hypothetical protein VX733_02020 [Candidatus Latescibacterota bacterium]|nr:hypothetical protein [Candidatus Latescibacterota bacterium]
MEIAILQVEEEPTDTECGFSDHYFTIMQKDDATVVEKLAQLLIACGGVPPAESQRPLVLVLVDRL